MASEEEEKEVKAQCKVALQYPWGGNEKDLEARVVRKSQIDAILVKWTVDSTGGDFTAGWGGQGKLPGGGRS